MNDTQKPAATPEQKPATPATPASNPQQTQGQPGSDKPGQQQQK
jgi:hypothetical protein